MFGAGVLGLNQVVEFTKEAVLEYLDTAIRFWCKRRDLFVEGDSEAVLYIDAFQSVRASLFGELLRVDGGRLTVAIGDRVSDHAGQNSPQLVTPVASAGDAVVPKMGDTLRCVCGLPWARLQGDRLVVQSKHRGKLHMNSISVWDLLGIVLKEHRGE